MDLMVYIQPLIKWWKLIVFSALLAGVGSFWVTLGQPENYQSRTTMLVGSAFSNPNPDSGQFYLAQQLSNIYVQLARSETVYRATMEALEMTWVPQYNVRVIPNSQLIEITVIDNIPARAQIIANELANQLIKLSPTNTSAGSTERQAFIEQQLDTLQSQILATREEILTLQQELGTLNSAREISDTKSQITALESKLSTLQTNYAGLLANTKEGAANTLQVIETATLPTQPIGPNKLIIVALTTVIGALVASGAAYLLEFLNKKLESIEELERVLQYPIVGYIPDIKNDEASWTFVDRNPLSPFAESFRTLRTNIQIRTEEIELGSILVCSALESEGKSTVTTNLAVAYSYLGKKIVIVDADLRRPKIHSVLGLESEPGLSDIISDDLDMTEAIQHWKGNIFLVSSGRMVSNPSELLSSKKFVDTINFLKSIADLVIIDCPPFFLAETSIVASKVDGVLIVAALGISDRDSVSKMKAQLETAKSPVIGVILNKIANGGRNGYYYNRESSYTEAAPANQEQGLSASLARIPAALTGLLKNIAPKEQKPAVPETVEAVYRANSKPLERLHHHSAQEAKTVPRITNPKGILDDVLLRSVSKKMESDKAHLQEIASKRRKGKDASAAASAGQAPVGPEAVSQQSPALDPPELETSPIDQQPLPGSDSASHEPVPALASSVQGDQPESAGAQVPVQKRSRGRKPRSSSNKL